MKANKYIHYMLEYLKDETKTVLNVSHTDLDGYGSSFMLYQAGCEHFVNTNYGEIQDSILNFFTKYEKLQNEDTMIVITDLNLNDEEIDFVNNLKKDYSINTYIMDHHGTGAKFAEKYDWYSLDTSISATMQVKNTLFDDDLRLNYIAELIDTYDMWRQEKDILFKKATSLSNLVFNTPFEDIDIKREWIFHLINYSTSLFYQSVSEFEESIYSNLNNFLLKNFDYDFIKDENLAQSVKCSLTMLRSIENYKILETNDVIVYSGISTGATQYCFNEMFKDDRYKDKVLINYNSNRGNLSIRSTNGNAQKIALLFGGGGHPDASGAHVDPDKGLMILKEKLC